MADSLTTKGKGTKSMAGKSSVSKPGPTRGMTSSIGPVYPQPPMPMPTRTPPKMSATSRTTATPPNKVAGQRGPAGPTPHPKPTRGNSAASPGHQKQAEGAQSARSFTPAAAKSRIVRRG